MSEMSKTQEVDLNFSYFFSYFYFLFNLLPVMLFLELGLRLEGQDHAVTQHVTSDNMVTSHKSHRRTWKVLEE